MPDATRPRPPPPPHPPSPFRPSAQNFTRLRAPFLTSERAGRRTPQSTDGTAQRHRDDCLFPAEPTACARKPRGFCPLAVTAHRIEAFSFLFSIFSFAPFFPRPLMPVTATREFLCFGATEGGAAGSVERGRSLRRLCLRGDAGR